jgi:hypothetical protein
MRRVIEKVLFFGSTPSFWREGAKVVISPFYHPLEERQRVRFLWPENPLNTPDNTKNKKKTNSFYWSINKTK